MFRLTFVLILSMLAGALRGADEAWTLDDLDSIYGEQGRIVEAIATLSRQGKYTEIPQYLSRDYTSVVAPEALVRKSKALEWRAEVISFGTVESYPSLSFVPVRIDVRAGKEEWKIDAVIFFVREDGHWKMANFPLLPKHFPSFGSIPSFGPGPKH